jgi:hypothetical protein
MTAFLALNFFSHGPATRQYTAISGNTRTKVQFLAAYCRLSVRLLPRIQFSCRVLPPPSLAQNGMEGTVPVWKHPSVTFSDREPEASRPGPWWPCASTLDCQRSSPRRHKCSTTGRLLVRKDRIQTSARLKFWGHPPAHGACAKAPTNGQHHNPNLRFVNSTVKNSNHRSEDSAEEAGLGFGTEVVFPNTEDAPAGAVDKFIVSLVGVEFLSPEGAVVRGLGAMFGTIVPKAAVHKEHEAGGLPAGF